MIKINLKETEQKSGANELNGRDFIRGLKYAAGAALLLALTNVKDVRAFADMNTYIDIINVAWASVVSYILLNIKQK